MGKAISLFNSYTESENRTSNYCGLMMKLVYQKSPDSFQAMICDLLDDEPAFDILPSFKQQEKQGNSIPVLTLRQNSFVILFETKNTDWHYIEQLKDHIANMRSADFRILFLLSDEFRTDIDSRIRKVKESSNDERVIIKNITFEKLLESIKSSIAGLDLESDDYLNVLAEEFENYLSYESLLPRSRKRIAVVPCGNTQDEISKGFYSCPNSGGIYSYQRTKFFGAYWAKQVNYIAEIKALVKFDNSANCFEVVWKNTNEEDDKLQKEAGNNLTKMIAERQQWVREGNWQMFLFDRVKEVDIKKTTKGALRGKTYWDIEADSLQDAVEEIKSKEW